MNGKVFGVARLRVLGLCVPWAWTPQIQLSGSRAQGSACLTKTPASSDTGERPQSEKSRPEASLAENNSGTMREGRARQGVKCCAEEFGLFLFSVERTPGRPSRPRVTGLRGEFCQQPGGELESGVAC